VSTDLYFLFVKGKERDCDGSHSRAVSVGTGYVDDTAGGLSAGVGRHGRKLFDLTFRISLQKFIEPG
jgi:hypothetical protein